MKIINYRILNESIIDQLIKSDQKQDAILNFLPSTSSDNNKSKNPIKSGIINNVSEPVNKSINGKYDVSFDFKNKLISGVFDVHITKNHDLITLKNNKETIGIKLKTPFLNLDDLINKNIETSYIKGSNFDVKNVPIKFTKIEKNISK